MVAKNKNDFHKSNEIEKDFITFISNRTGINTTSIEKKYIEIISEFKCETSEFKTFMDKVYRLNKVLYDYVEPSQQIKAYQQHELMLLLRYLTYSYKELDPKKDIKELSTDPYKKIKRYIKSAIKRPKSIEDSTFISNKCLENNDLSSNNWHNGLAYKHRQLAKYLISLIDKDPTVIDYGSGLGYISFEIAKSNSNCKTYLVDIDSLVNDFANYRFKKHNLCVESIKININTDLYPKLPFHNICIATEVMEHVNNPLIVLENIKSSLAINGIIFGNFQDHANEEQHISCDLSQLRNCLNTDFKRINEMTWQRIK